MKIAVLGGGLGGLGAAWHLAKQGCTIDLFDPIGIGGGASGIATGLIHPYAGEQGRRSLFATEGLAATEELIKAVGSDVVIQRGIIRFIQESAQAEMFTSHAQVYGDVKPHSASSYFVESGLTMDCSSYLQKIWEEIVRHGGQFFQRELKEWIGYDQIILSTGAAVKEFLPSLPISVIKGQVLKCRMPAGVSLPTNSLIGKGYLALSKDPQICYVGSTYERGDQSDRVDPEKAKRELFPKIAQFFPDVECLEVIDCKAAFRVVRIGHYFPLVKKVEEKVWVITGLGSRGLLYHAYLGKLLAEAIGNGKEKLSINGPVF